MSRLRRWTLILSFATTSPTSDDRPAFRYHVAEVGLRISPLLSRRCRKTASHFFPSFHLLGFVVPPRSLAQLSQFDFYVSFRHVFNLLSLRIRLLVFTSLVGRACIANGHSGLSFLHTYGLLSAIPPPFLFSLSFAGAKVYSPAISAFSPSRFPTETSLRFLSPLICPLKIPIFYHSHHSCP
ncbi:hypothetical protein DL96DRAFT_109129 [Flagelloscypha sp. PMI_526]|nr:hypothetical protein DL96DRAFT_109129 [Flagelloscypha sp. PMI_526]